MFHVILLVNSLKGQMFSYSYILVPTQGKVIAFGETLRYYFVTLILTQNPKEIISRIKLHEYIHKAIFRYSSTAWYTIQRRSYY